MKMAPSTAISLLLSIISLTRDGNFGFRDRERERERKTEEREREREIVDYLRLIW